MEKICTTAFIGITLSGELYIIRQYKGTNYVDCANWRNAHRDEISKNHKVFEEVTLFNPRAFKK